MYDLAMYLDLLEQHYLPDLPAHGRIVKNVLRRLKQHNPRLFDHVTNMAGQETSAQVRVLVLWFQIASMGYPALTQVISRPECPQ